MQAALYVAILTFDLIWLYFYRGEAGVRGLLMQPLVLVTLLIVTPGLAAAAMWYRQRLLQQLKSLSALRRAG